MVTRLPVAVSTAVLLSVAMLAACTNAVPQDDVEARVQDRLAEAGIGVGSISCPDGLEAEVGTTMTCEVEVESDDFSQVELEVYEVEENEVRYHITPILE